MPLERNSFNFHLDSLSGDLQHGVLATAAPVSITTNNEKRVTLAVNWWSSQPEPPNCMTLTNQQIQKMRLMKPNKNKKDVPAVTESMLSVEGEVVDYGKPIWTPSPIQVHTLLIPDRSSGLSIRHELTLPPGTNSTLLLRNRYVLNI